MWVILAIVILIGGVYIIARSNKNPSTAPATTTTTTMVPQATVVNYYCTEGSIVASYTTNAATLTVSDGRTLTLAQTVSASGVRYQSSDESIVFVTKGNNGFLQENGNITFNDCVAGSQTSTGNSFTFTDATKLFSFTYPNSGTLSGELGYAMDWRNNTETSGMLLAKVSIPGLIQPKTNFSEARFTVGTSSDATAVKNCLTDNMGGSSKSTLVTINGVQYTKLTAGDAGAGNLYETTSYRTVKNGQCYAVEYTIHSTQLGNYDPSQGIHAYDKTAVTNMLESIVQSFKFLS